MREPPDPGSAEARESGFTLIELLVVIIIIGILAAIAIPVYLNQRQRAFDSAAKSDIRNAAEFQEAHLASVGSYGSWAALAADASTVRPTANVTLTALIDGDQGYCLSAKHAQSPTTWYYDSRGGGLQPRGAAGCPITVAGAPGGSITG